MSKNKQSSVDYLISELQKSKDWHRVLNEVSQMSSAAVDIIAQAKAMHKEEIKEAYWNGSDGIESKTEMLKIGEQYYNETFNTKEK